MLLWPARATVAQYMCGLLSRCVLHHYSIQLAPSTCSTQLLLSKDMQTALLQRSAKPLLRFGIISDIQHADIPDGRSFHGVPRYYRNALLGLERAVATWKAADNLDFAIHMGDILDGYQPKDKSHEALDEVLSRFEPLGRPIYHLIGNHCLYNLPRPTLNDKLGLGHGCPSGVSYYSIQPHSAFRLIFADGYDISVLGWPPGHPSHEAAVKILNEKNPNANKNMPEGLVGVERRFVQFGGGATERQLDWIRDEILEAASMNQKVLVCCHLGFCPGSCPFPCLLWNYEEMLEVLRTTAPGTVIGTLAGHSHENGYVLDEWGIHHIVLPAVLETPPGRDCFGHIEVYQDGLELHGVDMMFAGKLELPYVNIADEGCKALVDMLKEQQARVEVLKKQQAEEKMAAATAVAP